MGRRRVALISDLHGNLLALERVLAAIERRGADEILCLGDVATLGPKPREVLALVRERCSHQICGNHDEYMFDDSAARAHTTAPSVLAAVDFCRSQLSEEEIDALRAFSDRATLPLEAGRSLLVFHGSPGSNNCDLVAETPEAELESHLAGVGAQVMAGGHTHVQLLRQHRGKWLVNPGSVGMPFERFVMGAPPRVLPHAEYALIDADASGLSCSLERVDLDRLALRAQAETYPTELGRYLVAQYS